MAQAGDARHPVAEICDLDRYPTILSILAATDPLGRGVDHVPLGQCLECVGIVALDPPTALHQLWVKCALHPVSVAVEPAVHVVQDDLPDGLLVAQAAPLSRDPSDRRDDLCELDSVDELPEARQLAVADLPDVDRRLVQVLAVALPVPV